MMNWLRVSRIIELNYQEGEEVSQSFWREMAGWRRDLREAGSPFLPGPRAGGSSCKVGVLGSKPRRPKWSPASGPSRGQMREL